MSDSNFPSLKDLRRFHFICNRIRSGASVSYRSIARASGKKYNFNSLNRSVLRLEAFYKSRLIQPSADGGLQMTAEGHKIYDMTRRIFRAIKDSFSETELRIRVADAVFAEVFPGVLRRLLPRWQGKVKLVFHKINYATIRTELLAGQSMPGYPCLGVGWDVLPETESSWAFRLPPAVRSVLIAPNECCGFRHRQDLPSLAAGLRDGQALFVLNQDQRPASLEPFLEGVKETSIVDCPNYNSILNLVRKQKLGAAVVPFWPWVLDKIALKRENGISYAFLPEAASQHVTCFIPPVGQVREEVGELIHAIRESLAELYPEVQPRSPVEKPVLPPMPADSSETTMVN